MVIRPNFTATSMVRDRKDNVISDSESTSDDGINESLKIALDSMKKSLSKCGTPKTQNESRPYEFIKATHQKIYDTFDSEDDLDEAIGKSSSSCKTDIKESSEISSFNTFVIDKGGADSNKDTDISTEVFTIDFDALEKGTEKEKPVKEVKDKKLKNKLNSKLSSSLQVSADVDDVYLTTDPSLILNKEDMSKKQQKKQELVEPEIMKKCVLTDEYEKQVTIDTEKSKRFEKKMRQLERDKTKGSKWFNMPAQEVTEERKNDFLVYQMRKAADPKRFYKNNDGAGIPKYYQMGTVVENAADFYDSRVPKKQRKANMVEELLADAKFRQFNKRKFSEIQEAKRQGTGPYRTMKKLKKKKAK